MNMKITSINNLSMPMFQVAPRKNDCSRNRNNLFCSDVFEKNNISFKGEEDFNLSSIDQIFIAAVSKNLLLKEDQQSVLRQEIINFLEDRKYKSLDEIRPDDETYPAMELANNIVEKLRLTQIEAGMFMSDLEERLQSKEKYIPTNRKYQWDINLMSPILKQYGFGDDVFAYMCQDASDHKYESLFDIFRTENDPIKSKTYKYLYENSSNNNRNNSNDDEDTLNDENLANLMIQLNYLTDMDTPQKRFDVLLAMYMDSRDNAIACDIANRFFIDVEDALEMVKKLDDPNILPIQVAFEIADKYRLPQNAENEILEMINAYAADKPTEEDV